MSSDDRDKEIIMWRTWHLDDLNVSDRSKKGKEYLDYFLSIPSEEIMKKGVSLCLQEIVRYLNEKEL